MAGEHGRTSERPGDDLFTGGLAALLRPIIRYCLRHSIKLQRFIEVAKGVYVEIGEEQMLRDGHEVSTSRLAVMTGVHRKDVVRLGKGETKKRLPGDTLARVVGQWRNDPRFSRKNGHPRPLDLGGGSGEFAELVLSVSKELNPYTILFELERLKLINREGNTVALLANEYIPKKRPLESLRLVSADYEDILNAAEENVFEEPKVPNLHLTTRYDNVAIESLPTIRRWLMAEGAKLHQRARTYLAKHDKDLNPRLDKKAGGGRVVLGSFGLTSVGETPEEDK